MKTRWLKYLLVLALITLSGWVTLLYLTAKPATPHPFFSHPEFNIIAHRGGGVYLPENTLPAFINSHQLGADILEMDLRVTKDRRLVIFHDKTLNRTTECQGLLSQFTLDSLLQCPIRNNRLSKNERNENQTTQSISNHLVVPTLREVFERFPTKRMVIEIKDDDLYLVERFCTLIKQFKKESQILVGSFRQNAIDQFRKSCPQVATSATMIEGFQFYLLSKVRLTKLLSPSANALILPWRTTSKKANKFFFLDIITPSLVEQAQHKNLPVLIFTVNKPQEMEKLIKLGVQGIMTDYPDRLIFVQQHSKNIF